jgi:histidinol-phosphate aminotransferase
MKQFPFHLFKTLEFMQPVSRRDWLRLSGLALAGMTLQNNLTAKGIMNDLPLGTPLAGNPMARLSSNENPYGPSEKVKKAIIDNMDVICRYPFSYQDELLQAIADWEGVSKNHIVLTAGSTEGLKITGLTVGWKGGEIISPDPTFNSLMVYAEQFGAKIHKIPATPTLDHDLTGMASKINSNTKLVFVCNPNNPTGTLIPENDLRSFCKQAAEKTTVFVDEAYFDFITTPDYPSMVELVKQGMNVIVSRTFSKVYGLAGLRMGYLVAQPDMAAKLINNRVAFVGTVGMVAAKEALADKEFYAFSLLKNKEAKEHIYATLDSLGLVYMPSHTNFVFFKPKKELNSFNKELEKRGVLAGRPFPPLLEWSRISTGTTQEMQQFRLAMQQIYG